MGRLDLADPASADLASWKSQPHMLGIRVILSGLDDTSRLDSEAVAWFWAAAEQHDIPVMVFAPGQTPDFAGVAARHPRLRLIVDHLNLSGKLTSEGLGSALEAIYPLAAWENVAMKISALPSRLEEPYPFPSLAPHIRRVVDTFGPERCLWGSDLSQLRCPYIDWVRALRESTGLTSDETDLVMGGAAATWLDWPD
jgi:predicted TIM-barrel fold metal-dependent hydrolase